MTAQETVRDYTLPDGGAVHVWVARISELRSYLASLSQVLSPKEQEIAGKFIHSVDRSRYIVAHGVLRSLLGQYLNVFPETIRFVTNAFGKPELAAAENSLPLRFNLAHAEDIVVYALTLKRSIGVDVEFMRHDIDAMELAASQFADEEINELRSLAPLFRREAFYRGWTHKEAYLKARGEGVSFAFNQFAVTLKHGEPARILRVEEDVATANAWVLMDLEIGSGYAAALAVEGSTVKLISRRWRHGFGE